jgi:hypothetical protein
MSGPWDWARAARFLTDVRIPVRIATSGRSGPLVQSLWYEWRGDALWCATQLDAVVTRRLRADPVCGFEVAGDLPPYRGVRGQARVEIQPAQAAEVLPRLLDRYHVAPDAELRAWLLSRLDSEVALRLVPLRATTWDYSARMSR